MMKTRGRPARIDRTRVINSILEKKDVLVQNDKIVSKTNKVWNAIAKDLDNLIKPATLYKMVMCNENNLRDKITSSECSVPDPGFIHDDSVQNDSVESTNDTDGNFSNESSDEPVPENFSFLVPKSEFAGLLTTKNFVRNEKSLGKVYSRSRTFLKPGRWQDWLVEKIWTHKQLKCGFNFKSNKFVKDGTRGVIRGRCKCGSALRCNVENEDENEYVTITCSITAGVMLTADGNFPIMQMITESHRSTSIHAWLKEWIRSGAPRPREVISDSSRALLIAAIEAFTGFLTIEEYANACALEVPPHTYFRIDVAHFIKNYAKILKDVPKRVRRFLLASVGQLIMATTVEMAAETLTSLLIISRSETTGELTTGNKSTCDVHFHQLKAQLDPRLDEFLAEESTEDIVEENGVNEDSADTNVESQNWWVTWGRNIDQRAKTIASNEEGDRENAFYLPKFADRLVKDVSLLPLWSSVCRNKFGYGRIPASSAAVESEFNIIKTHLQKNISALVRPDAFVEKHVNYLNGKIKIVHANVNNGKDVDADHKLHERSDVEEFSIAEVDRIEHVNAEKDLEPEIEHSESEIKIPEPEIKYPEPEIEYPEPEIVAANELENWRGLATPKKTSRIPDLTKIPIIKNGNNMTLQV